MVVVEPTEVRFRRRAPKHKQVLLTINFDVLLAATSNPVAIPANGIVARSTTTNLKATVGRGFSRLDKIDAGEVRLQDNRPPTTTNITPAVIVKRDHKTRAEAERILKCVIMA